MVFYLIIYALFSTPLPLLSLSSLIVDVVVRLTQIKIGIITSLIIVIIFNTIILRYVDYCIRSVREVRAHTQQNPVIFRPHFTVM